MNLLCDTEYEVRVRTRCGTESANFSAIVRFRTLSCLRLEEREATVLSNLSVYPNPNKGTFFVRFELQEPGEVTAQVIDLTGRVVWRGTQVLSAGEQTMPIELSEAAAGVYMLEVKIGAAASRTVKVIVN